MYRHLIPSLLVTAVVLCGTTLPVYAAPKSAITKTDLCAIAGRNSDTLVESRDRGIPPMEAMTNLDHLERKNPNQKAAIAFLRWIVIEVYKYPSMDAAWLRQRVEITCFEQPL